MYLPAGSGNNGKNGSGGSLELPDYSTSPILYPRKWVDGRDIHEVVFDVSLDQMESAGTDRLLMFKYVSIPELVDIFIESHMHFQGLSHHDYQHIGYGGSSGYYTGYAYYTNYPDRLGFQVFSKGNGSTEVMLFMETDMGSYWSQEFGYSYPRVTAVFRYVSMPEITMM
ncbi:MAG: hypothetical protein KatS3mg101_1150 [Patescibacteria group bacterium]|nr:MAG: hypothetical protein KatS3mg101_1150 [Patescibacteria group bacterium]